MQNRGLIMLVASGVVGCSALAWSVFMNDNPNGTDVTMADPISVEVPKVQIVVASQPILQGETVSLSNLTVTEWPQDDVPYGAYTALNKLGITDDASRQALTDIAQGAPVLSSRLSVEGAQQALSARLKPGMRAYAIRTDEVAGVGGFVLPGARVDVLHTQKPDGMDITTKVILKNVEVLAVDRNDNVLSEEPAVAKTTTLAVNLEQAQALSIAAQEGRLSLALVGSAEMRDNPEMQTELVVTALSKPKPQAVRKPKIFTKQKNAEAPIPKTASTVEVVLGDKSSISEVPNGAVLRVNDPTLSSAAEETS